MATKQGKGARAGSALLVASVRKRGGGRIYPKNGKALAIPWARIKKWAEGKDAKAKAQLDLPFPPPKALRPVRPAAKVRHTTKHKPKPPTPGG